jgi:hypothetical protein
MLFKNAFEQQPTLRFVYEKLQFYSVLGRQFLLNQPFITDSDTLSAEHERLSEVMVLWQDTTLKPVFSHLSQQIHQLNNIAPTLSALENGAVLDDIQLFEIKKTAILTNFIAQDVKKLGISWLEYHPMEEVITILDPEHTFIPHFYVYSAYDEELACLREKMKSVNNAQEIETYRFQAQQVEDRLRAELSDKLRLLPQLLILVDWKGKDVLLLNTAKKSDYAYLHVLHFGFITDGKQLLVCSYRHLTPISYLHLHRMI